MRSLDGTMSDPADLDEAGLRLNLRPWAVGLAVNLLVGATLLGYPYFRGTQRAEAVPPRFAAFAGCFYQADPVDRPGLGLPPGERARYASLVLGDDPDWPERCIEPLRAVSPEESLFLFPNVKNAEAQVRAAVELMADELEELAERRSRGDRRVPDRPMRAMSTLRGALAELGVSSGVSALSADRDAVVIEPGADDDLAIASIVPLHVSVGGPWSIAMEDGALLAGVMDSRAVAWVRVGDGGVEQRATRRPSLVSGMLGARATPWLLWTTSSTTCEESEEGCVNRATGLAAFLEDRQTLEPMMWLGAHPLGAPERSAHVGDGVVHILALDDAGARVMRFSIPEPEVRALGEEIEVPQITAEGQWSITPGEGASFLWIEGEPLRLLFASEAGGGLLPIVEEATITPLEVPPGHDPQVAACGPWRAIATDRGARVHRDGGVAHATDAAIVPPEPRRLALSCRAGRASLWTLDERTLTRHVCTAAGCGAAQVVDDDVAAFDVATHGEATLLATTSDREEGLVRLIRYGADGTESSVPAPCWTDPVDGLCGEPRLASDGEVLAIVTRQGENLRVVASRDGRTFGALAGLEQR